MHVSKKQSGGVYREANVMKLIDIVNGPEWVIWVVFAVFLIITIVLLTGKGANLVAGYNTASEAEKAKYDDKKISRVVGIGIAVITVFILFMGLYMETLPAFFAYVFAGTVFVDSVTLIVLVCTVCKKK